MDFRPQRNDASARGPDAGRCPLVVAVVVLLLASCGPPRIKKMPVPDRDASEALRLMSEGDQLLRDSKDHLAMSKFLDASLKNPYHEVIFNKLAVTYARLRMFEQAGEAVDRSLALNWDYAFAHNTKGIVELSEADLSGASKAFRRAIALRPDVGNFYLNLGYAQILRGHYDDARESYRKGLEAQPNLFEDETGIMLTTTVRTPTERSQSERYFQMARVFAELGNLDFCLRYLRQALTLGFSDFKKILEGDAFQKFHDEPEYQDFLARYGIQG